MAAAQPPDDNIDDDDDDETADVECTTSAGPFVLQLHRSWSPHGYDRATSLFEKGYYDDSHFFRVVPGFLVQFGISYTTDIRLRADALETIPDDPHHAIPFDRPGVLSFAGSGPNSRTSQLFISYGPSKSLGTQLWETPLGTVTSGMDTTVNRLYSGYGDMPPWGKGPEQGKIRNRGAKYIEEEFPKMDKFLTCKVHRHPAKRGKSAVGGGNGIGDGAASSAAGAAARKMASGGTAGKVKTERGRLRSPSLPEAGGVGIGGAVLQAERGPGGIVFALLVVLALAVIVVCGVGRKKKVQGKGS